ncbi:MAG TPA: phosphatase PAP2 family protein [Steroidobacteraceae bacterium]|nr:phosphatase PAP2 family protein [Steroidobacteraceae bacterium]
MDPARRLTLGSRRLLTSLSAALSLSVSAVGWTQTAAAPAADLAATPASSGEAAPSGEYSTSPRVLSDIGAYFSAPLHWDGRDWAWVGAAVLTVGLAHRYDTQVRTHFVGPGAVTNVNTHDANDAIPTAAVFGGTWALAILINDPDGYREGWAMAEAAGLSGVTAYVLKFAARRETPYETTNPNEWGKSGSSFPSFHSTASFAVGTVLAESGNDEYRWVRRLLGYGLGVATSYERLRHDAHWLSDTVAGAALGISSAHFVIERRYGASADSRLALVPIEGGAMLTYRLSMQ